MPACCAAGHSRPGIGCHMAQLWAFLVQAQVEKIGPHGTLNTSRTRFSGVKRKSDSAFCRACTTGVRCAMALHHNNP